MKKGILFAALFFLLPAVVRAETFDVYVDKDNNSGIEDGSKANPFNTIMEGIEAALEMDEDQREVFVANGEYREKVKIGKKVELYGQDKNKTVIYGKDESNDEFSYAVKMKNKSKIKNFTIKYGKTGVLVDEDAKATIKKCKIKKSDEIGVEVLRADRNDKKMFTMEDSKVYDGDGKAMYIRKRKVDINENEVYDNEEEGIDLRSKVKGKIYDNEIYDNGESGIEFEMRSVKLKIKDNKIKSNEGSGITAQYRGNNPAGEVEIEDNSIKKNSDFGLRCARPQGGTPSLNYFSSSIMLLDNAFKNNDAGTFSQLCRF